ncbi:MAG TPA: YggS family pyridoxal phosphate-dependent enzyme [Gemmatimonadaceae bacterium]|nr:YggS family pyridoxal phosphate-dependent enzyme [Gemmatimonadaceae bacterium]
MAFAEFGSRVQEVRDRIDAARARGGHGQTVRLIAVTKTHGADAVDAAAACGIGDVGENKVQEALDKMQATTASVRWHLIGQLQRNKAKAAPNFSMVHSLDSVRLADALQQAAAQAERTLDVLVQVNVAGEAQKGGVAPAEVQALAAHLTMTSSLRVAGVMCLAPFTDDESILRPVFEGARAALATVRAAGHGTAHELSMGMSGDYEIAVEEGATLVRLGTVLFGARS